MMYFVLESPFLPLLVLVVAFYFMRFCTSRLQLNEFDSVGQLNLNTAFSLSSLTAMWGLRYVEGDEFLFIGSLYLLFYVVVGITSVLTINRKQLTQKRAGYDASLFSDPHYQYIVASVTGLILALTSIFFAYILVAQGLAGDDRIALAKDFRVLDLIRRGFATVFTYYSISCFIQRRDRYLLALLIFNVAIGFFSGSKSFFAEYITAYITIDTLIKGRQQNGFKKYLPVIGMVLMLTMGMVMFWQKVNFVDAVISVANRLFASGDIFYYSFIHNNYKELFGTYDFWPYVLHPFTSLFGIRGYEWPIGSLLFAQPGVEIKGFGPNPQLPMTAIILFKGNPWLSVLFCSFIAVLTVFAHNFALRVLKVRSLPTVLRTSVFAICFVKSTVLLVDFSLVAIDLIAVFSMTFVTLGFQSVLDRRDISTARKTERLQALIGKQKSASVKPNKSNKSPETVTPPPEPVRSKKLDQFQEFVSATTLRNNRLKALAELLNINNKPK
jgi:hypothetical protein